MTEFRTRRRLAAMSVIQAAPTIAAIKATTARKSVTKASDATATRTATSIPPVKQVH